MKSVSVVIPCHNVADYLRDCLESVLCQEPRPLEIICVDDDSSDATLDILREYESRHRGFVTVLAHSPNRGATASRNDGLRIARGEYIQFLDADDLLLAGKLHHQLGLIEGETKPVLVAASYRRLLVNGGTVERHVEDANPLEALIKSGLGITSANLWPRRTLLDIGGWDEGLGSSQEYNLMFRLLKAGVRVRFDPAICTVIRERASGSITHKDPSANCRRFIDLRLQALRYARETSAGPAVEKAALQVLFEWIHFLYRYDSEAASRLYAEHIRGKYSPRYSKLLTRKYMVLYRLLGFDKAERLRTMLSPRSTAVSGG
jgi:glycosyltransferase involved in cell wall biosynthesis